MYSDVMGRIKCFFLRSSYSVHMGRRVLAVTLALSILAGILPEAGLTAGAETVNAGDNKAFHVIAYNASARIEIPAISGATNYKVYLSTTKNADLAALNSDTAKRAVVNSSYIPYVYTLNGDSDVITPANKIVISASTTYYFYLVTNNGSADTLQSTFEAATRATADCYWNSAGNYDISWYSGAGPYTISTPEQLAGLIVICNGLNGVNADSFSGKTIRLSASVDMSANLWSSVGNVSRKFLGNFDGGNYNGEAGAFSGNNVISGLHTNGTAEYQSLFGYMGSGATIKNVGVVNGYIKGSNYISGIAAYAAGAITNCYNTGVIKGASNVSGIAAHNASGAITNCYNTGAVNGALNIGGIAGVAYGAITNCCNTGAVTGSGNPIGGIVGDAYGAVTNCCNTGAVSCPANNSGGIAGLVRSSAPITNCYNTGDVGGWVSVGGIAGASSREVINCYNTGSIKGYMYVGGVVGSSAVANCYNAGTVTGTTQIGGVVGAGAATNCYSIGTLAGKSSSGGVAGAGSMTNCYTTWTGNIAGSATVTNSYCAGTSNTTTTFTNDAAGITTLLAKLGAAYCAAPTQYAAGGVFGTGNPVNKGFPVLKAFGYTGDDSSVAGELPKDTDNTTYLIKNAYQMDLLRDSSLGLTGGKCFKLAGNIDLSPVQYNKSQDTSGSWNPIGTSSAEFLASFDGNNNIVSQIYINGSSNYQGLFGYVGSDASVRNIGMVNNYIKGGSLVGSVAGQADGTVSGCYSTGIVSGVNIVGGIAGQAGDTVSECYSIAAVSSTGNCAGGVAGLAYGAITNCCNIGAVSGEMYIGGVAGEAHPAITNCCSIGVISGTGEVGGIAGRCTAENCYNIGVVSSAGGVVGGVAGSGKAANCYNTAAVSGTGSYIGGIVGDANGAVTTSYNTGAVSGGADYVGGVVGQQAIGAITNCYSTGTVSGSTRVGGVAGFCSGTLTYNYYCGYSGGIGKYNSAAASDTANGTIPFLSCKNPMGVGTSADIAGIDLANLNDTFKNAFGITAVQYPDAYESSDTKIITASGKTITAIDVGTAFAKGIAGTNSNADIIITQNALTASGFSGAVSKAAGAISLPITVVPFVGVIGITGVPTGMTAGTPLALTGTVAPEDATNKDIVWSVKTDGGTGAVISGNTLSATGAGTAEVTATIKNGATKNTDYTCDYSITVKAAPKITTASLETGKTDTTYSQTLTATGTAPITWSLEGGSVLPTGLTLTDGVISGTPTEKGTFSFTVKASNSLGSDTKELSITVNAAPAITTTSLPIGKTGESYSHTLAATGTEPFTWSLESGTALPEGLSLSDGGIISGTPTAAGVFNFKVTATNVAGSNTKELSITVNAAPAITTDTLPSGKKDAAYSQSLTSTGTAPITWSLESGATLPAGLSLSKDGLISGTPTAAGTVAFKVTATNVAGSSTKELSITVNAGSAITTTLLPSGKTGVPYSQTLAATGTAPITWSLESGSVLPAGLTLTDGVISGTPTTAGIFNFKVTATNIAGSDTKSLSITVNTVPKITTVGLGSGKKDAAYSQTLIASGTAPITWSLESGTVLPAGLGLSNDGIISGTPTVAGTFSFKVNAVNVAGSDTKELSITVNAAPAITTTKLESGKTGIAYSQTLAAAGTAPITWSLESGSVLPAGLTLTDGVISGTPTTAGIFNFKVTATNVAGSNTKELSITVNTAPKITTSALDSGKKGISYSQTLTATGTAPITWSVIIGSLPAGLTLVDGVISGTPTEAGKSDFTVRALNVAGNDTKVLSITVNAAPEITTAKLDSGKTGVAYSQTLAATGTAPITWSLESGSLPAGLSISTGGIISGTPIGEGKSDFTVKATNVAGSDTTALSITVNTVPKITTVGLLNGKKDAAYSQTLTASGTAPITWSLESGTVLPAGLGLSKDGIISGTPTAVGVFSFKVTATNVAGSDTKELSITVNAAPAITTAKLDSGKTGVSYSQTLAATGTAPITWSLESGSLPAGLSISTDGIIGGTPTGEGKSDFTVKATNAAGSDTKSLSITVNTVPKITTVSLSNGMMDTVYSQTLAATGTKPITWSLESGSLPAGLSISTDGIISGTPVEAGKSDFTVKASNVAGSDTKSLSITVSKAPPKITTVSLEGGKMDCSYSQTLTAAGTAPFTWSVMSGSLPAGLNLSAGGIISGTPTTEGSYSFTVNAANEAGNDSRTLSITVSKAPPKITTTSLESGKMSYPYLQTLAAEGTKPITWSLESGSALPAGLNLSGDGIISGTPTVAGVFNVKITAVNDAGNDTKELSITVNTAPKITTAKLDGGTMDTSYSQTIDAEGTKPITWSVDGGSLPAGLSLSKDGVISGTPTASGIFNFTVKALNVAGSDTKALSITISKAPPKITTASLKNGTIDYPYSQTLTATGTAPITWSITSGNLPEGLSLSEDGIISGTPTEEGSFSFKVTAANSVSSNTKKFSITVSKAPDIITGFILDYTTKAIPYGTDFSTLNLPQKLQVVGNGITGLWVKVSKWIYSVYDSATYIFKPVLDSGYVDSGYVDSGYVLDSGVNLPEITVTVGKKPDSGDNGNSGKHSSQNSSSSSPTAKNVTETKVDKGGNTATVTTKPSSVTENGNTVSIETDVPSITIDNTATSTNGDTVDTTKKAAVTINIPTQDVNQQLNAKKNIELTITVPPEVLNGTNANLAVAIDANREVLEAAKANLCDVTIRIKDAETQQIAYSWKFRGEDLAKSNIPITDVNIAMSVHLTTEVPKVNVLTPGNKGLVLSFNQSGQLPSVASVKISALEKGFKPGQKLYFYYYNPITKQMESLGTDAYTVDPDGCVTVQIAHCSDYVLLPNAARSLTLDTKTYTMPLKNSYEIGVKLTNTKGTTVKVYSSTKGVASIIKLKNGNYRVTGLKSGLTYIMFDVYDEKKKLLSKAHASVKLIVKSGVNPSGDSWRQTAVF